MNARIRIDQILADTSTSYWLRSSLRFAATEAVLAGPADELEIELWRPTGNDLAVVADVLGQLWTEINKDN